MKILYGVVGEGMGHATRSRVLLEELVKHHEVQIVVSGRAREYLAKRFENVHNIWGLTIAYEGNSVRNLQTALQNLRGAMTGWPQNVARYFKLAEAFEPEVVISDFETFSYLFGRTHGLPVLSVDNMQVINRCAHDPALLEGHRSTFELTRALVKGKLPGCFHYLVSSFFYPPVRKPRTSLLPPILRPEILEAKREKGEHLLVYQTATTNASLPAFLKRTGLPCRVYGVKRDLTADERDGNLTYRPFSEAGFIDDLRTARAVLTGGGFTLMSESVSLHKPVLSLPVGGQFEQVLNALYLEREGYGMYAPEMSEARLGAFLERLPDCERALAGYSQDGNRLMLEALEAQLQRARLSGTQDWDEVTES
jgi:uncharacterized protein (TIGR00661 family)